LFIIKKVVLSYSGPKYGGRSPFSIAVKLVVVPEKLRGLKGVLKKNNVNFLVFPTSL